MAKAQIESGDCVDGLYGGGGLWRDPVYRAPMTCHACAEEGNGAFIDHQWKEKDYETNSLI